MKYSAFAIAILCALSELSKAERSYTVKNEGVEHFNGFKETKFHMSEIKLIGRQRLLNGTITFDEDMASDHYKVQVELFSSPQGDDQFKRLPMGVPRTTICEGIKGYYGQVLQPSFIQGKITNFPVVTQAGLCPIPKGEYYIKNLEFDTESWPNQIPRGIIKGVLTIFKDELNVGGGAFYLRVEDRD
ncbi:PREDICTED: uncharacterized protein LOC108381537 [Rhagoletis zephyria]|uniref:uncharacterized protein LOC108381537 n=1 Tax=Rhagoletis zephyria TaxID=28612 RepID=UPI000811702A|nr:PREDICTED: uncharacterized protein LOC108381537 [Rhagoletis zephyria]